MSRFVQIWLIFTISIFAAADTLPPGQVKSKTEDGSGTPITSTLLSGKQGLDVNVISSGGGMSTVTQGPSNGGSDPWWVQGTVGITGSITASNPSVSTTGTAVPASATLVGGSDGTDLRSLKVSSAGVLSVDGSATTQPVSGSVSVSNFPGTQAVSQSGTWTVGQGSPPWSFNLSQLSGSSPSVTNYLPSRITNGTAYVDPTQIRALSSGTDSINVGNFPSSQPITGTVTANAGTGTFTVGQSSGSNLHADIDNFPATQAVTQSGTWNLNNITGAISLPTGASTSALQSTGNSSLTTINTTLGSPMQNSGGTVAATESGTWNITNVTGTVSLPTGASTSALQTTGNSSLSTIASNQTNAGQKTQIVDGSGNVVGPITTISSINYLPVIQASSATPGSAVPARSTMVAGTDGTNARIISTDTNGVVQTSLGNTSGKTIIGQAGNLSSTTTTSNQVVVTYTVTAGKTFYLQLADCSVSLNTTGSTQEQYGTCSLMINGAIVWTQYYKGPGVANFDPILTFSEPIPVSAGQVVQWVATPFGVTNFLWYANIMGYQK